MSADNIELLNKFNELSEERRKEIIENIQKHRKYSFPDFIRILLKTDDEYEKVIALVGLLANMNLKNDYDGKEHHYRVATLCGGIMERPDYYYENEQIITAMSEQEAEDKYNKKNKCSYYYGKVIGKLD